MSPDLVVSLRGKELYRDCWITKCEGEFIIQTNKCTTYINNILYIVITPTCFNASASSSGNLNLVLYLVTKLLKLKLNKSSRLNVHWIIAE